MKNTIKIILGFTIVLNSVTVFSQAGSLDNTFNGNGLAVTGSSNGINDNGRAVLVQDDGKIVLVGLSDGRIGVIRYNEDGSLDNTFDDDGIVITPYGNNRIYGMGAAIQDDGKIIVGGCVDIFSGMDFSVVRYNTDGTLDHTFGNEGIAIASRNNSDVGFALCLQDDGKILVGGYSFIEGTWYTYEFSIVRFNFDGTLDLSFGTYGFTHVNNPNNPGYLNEILSLTIQEDGKVVAAGQSYDFDYDVVQLAVLRFNIDGTLDESFNSTGMVFSNLSDVSKDCANSAAIQDDNKIVVGGFSESNSDQNFALSRYNPDGILDQTFGNQGQVTTDLGSFWDYGYALTIQSDGKIIMAGVTNSPTDVDYALVRYNTDGSIDESFGNNGIVLTDFGIGDDKARAICTDLEGRIIAAGYSGNLSSGVYDYSIARYLNDLSTGVIDFNNDITLNHVYPNPITNSTTLEYVLTNEETINICLYDAHGKLLQQFIKNSIRNKGEHKEHLIINDLIPSGSYILTIDNGMTVNSIKVFIQ